MSRQTPKSEVLRALFALSGNRCAFPGCNHRLINDKGIFIAQLCHIEAANKGGQRFNANQTDEERRADSNLLLLCYEHHKETDDVAEFPVRRLQEIKKNHEEQFRGQYELPENLTEKVMVSVQNQLEKITDLSQDTNTLVHEMKDILNRFPFQSSLDEDKYYISQLDSIKELRKEGKYKTVIDLLLDFKEKNWDKLSPELRCKVLVNLGICYLDLHEGNRGAEYLIALSNIAFETPDTLSLICLGYAITEKYPEFDNYFEKALKQAPDNVNLWVGYLERHKKDKTIEELLQQVPAPVAESVPMLFSIGSRLIADGRKKEGLDILKKALNNPDDNIQKQADSKALVATRILEDLFDPYKYRYNDYTPEELAELEEAKTMLTQAWEVIGETEQARFKWYIILNRGVINKITGKPDQALPDIQKAFDLSKEFLPFKNLFMTLLQLDKLDAAKLLLSAPGFIRSLNEQENYEIETMKPRLLCLQGKYREAIPVMAAQLNKENEQEYINIITQIILVCFENKDLNEPTHWCDKLISEFPLLITGYIFSGYLWKNREDTEKSLKFYKQAFDLLSPNTPPTEILELASGLSDLGEYAKAIPLFEQLSNKNILNTFSRGLIHAFYQSGDLQAALVLAENLFLTHPEHTYLAEIIGNIHQETRQYDKAIAVIQTYLPFAGTYEKDVFNYRLARLYAYKRDWESVKQFALQIQNPGNFSLDDVFNLAFLMVKSGEEEKGLEIAFDARTHFFDNSKAHLKYISIIISVKKPVEDLFPAVVRSECAVVIRTDSHQEKTFLITKKTATGENVLRPADVFAQQLIGRAKDETINISKGYGFSYKASITRIIDIYTHAFQESLNLFETRFAGQENVGVLHANPGETGDEVEQFIKGITQDKDIFEKPVYDLYNQRRATLGVLAGLFNRNAVMQWFALLSSPDVSMICLTQSEFEATDFAVTNNKPLILDLTALLSMFFIVRDNNHFIHLDNELIVSQATVDELQECYEDMENGAKDGMFTMSYERGQLIGHSTSKETIEQHRQILQNIIMWLKENTRITTSVKLLGVKRDERQRMSGILGDCFYDTMLLAEEYEAIVITDDDNFKPLLLNNSGVPFSTYQLVQWLTAKGKIPFAAFERYSMQLILSNHICIPLTGEQLWQCFDTGGFQLRKPFTVAIKGLLVMRADSGAISLAKFFKRLYVESGLAITRQQTVLYVLKEVSLRNDYEKFKNLFFIAIEKEFRLLPIFKKDLIQLLKVF